MLDATDWQMLLKQMPKNSSRCTPDVLSRWRSREIKKRIEQTVNPQTTVENRANKQVRVFPDATSENKKNASWDDP